VLVRKDRLISASGRLDEIEALPGATLYAYVEEGEWKVPIEFNDLERIVVHLGGPVLLGVDSSVQIDEVELCQE
jgi:hypothetical protein